MQLQAWLERQTISPAEFARSMNVARATVSRWLSGERRPRAAWLRAINKATAGKVRPEDWPRANGAKRA